MTLSRRQFLIHLSAFITLPLVIKCKNNTTSPLLVASHIWSGYELIFLAQREGWLTSAGLQLVESPSASASIQLLAENKVNAATLTLDEVLRARAQGISLTVVMVFDISTGADMLLVKPSIRHLSDLAGKRIGVEQSALGALMLFKILQKAALPQSAVIVVSSNFNEHYDLWHSNKIDALITFEPTASQLLAQNAQNLFDSREIPETIFDVLAIKSDALDNHEFALKNLIAGHFKARHYLQQNSHDAAYRMAERLGLSSAETLNSFRGLDLPDINANRKYLVTENSPLLKSTTELMHVMLESGLLSAPDNLENFMNDHFL